MKKLLLVAFVTMSFSACSDSDNENELDPFIGTWYFFSENGKEVNDCNKKSTLIISEYGNFTSINYGNQDNPDECIIENTDNGTWLNIDTNKYEIINNSNSIKQVYTIIFSDNGNTFKSETKFNNTTDTSIFKRK